jgi:CheY-like chemotaxis protein
VPTRVLIVDDEPDVTTYVAAALEAHDIKTVVANNVEDGMELVYSVRPNLVFLDIMMPQQSGLSMYVKIRQSPHCRNVPVVILSGVPMEEQNDLTAYLQREDVAMPDCFLEKPVAASELVATVHRLAPSVEAEREKPHG